MDFAVGTSNPTLTSSPYIPSVVDAREVTKKEKEEMFVYISPSAIDGLLDSAILKDHEKVAEKYEQYEFKNDDGNIYSFITNFLPGVLANRPIMGRDSHVMKDGLQETLDREGNPTPKDNADIFTSDKNPLFKFLYHFIPGSKSFSEIHDLQMVEYERETGSNSTLVNIITIPPSFAKTFMNALTQGLDVGNWGTHWKKYIKPSYKLRTEKPNNGGTQSRSSHNSVSVNHTPVNHGENKLCDL